MTSILGDGTRVYGQWPGNPKGEREDKLRCVESVATGFIYLQCSRKRGHGKDGLYCKQHGKMREVKP